MIPAPESSVVDRAVAIIQQRTGMDTPVHRRHVIEGALRQAAGDDGLEAGLRRLFADQEQFATMISALTIGETYLFRHYGHYQSLRALAQKRRAHQRSCRVLSAGCATGEEAWSAAAVLADVYGDQTHRTRVVGWDIDRTRIAHARRARYRQWSARNGLRNYQHYFDTLDDTILVSQQLRPLVSFQTVNLAQRPLPRRDKFDAIFFRNVAIYWLVERINEVMAELGSMLHEDGLLFVGPADPVRLGDRWEKRVDHDAIVFALSRVQPEKKRPSSAKPKMELRGSDSQLSRRLDSSRSIRRKRLQALERFRERRSTGFALPDRQTHAPGEKGGREAQGEELLDPFERAQQLADKGRYREALSYLESLESPLAVPVRLLKAVVLLNLERLDQALRLFKQCVFLEPDQPAHRQWLAVAYEALGRPEAAQREWRNLARLNAAQTDDTTAGTNENGDKA
ncbi:MAG: CheR family methyltransferase [Persicimonas sp.]